MPLCELKLIEFLRTVLLTLPLNSAWTGARLSASLMINQDASDAAAAAVGKCGRCRGSDRLLPRRLLDHRHLRSGLEILPPGSCVFVQNKLHWAPKVAHVFLTFFQCVFGNVQRLSIDP